jgi:hypothetical protein
MLFLLFRITLVKELFKVKKDKTLSFSENLLVQLIPTVRKFSWNLLLFRVSLIIIN